MLLPGSFFIFRSRRWWFWCPRRVPWPGAGLGSSRPGPDQRHEERTARPQEGRPASSPAGRPDHGPRRSLPGPGTGSCKGPGHLVERLDAPGQALEALAAGHHPALDRAVVLVVEGVSGEGKELVPGRVEHRTAGIAARVGVLDRPHADDRARAGAALDMDAIAHSQSLDHALGLLVLVHRLSSSLTRTTWTVAVPSGTSAVSVTGTCWVSPIWTPLASRNLNMALGISLSSSCPGWRPGHALRRSMCPSHRLGTGP